MKIGIIGAGFTGLSAGYQLLLRKHDVMIFEADAHPGGLALGFKEPNWDWSLEKHYHHWFTNDYAVLNLAKELHYDVVVRRPKTSVFLDGDIEQLDSPLKLLTFPKLPLLDRLRMATVFAVLFRFNPFWKLLEGIKITNTLPKLIGERSYKMIWEPQLLNKMGKDYIDDISLVWFWARIKKRTTSLAYPKGGYLQFAQFVSKTIQKMGGNVHYNTKITSLEQTPKGAVTLTIDDQGKKRSETFDKVLVTLPTHQFLAIAQDLPASYTKTLTPLKGLGATNLVLRLKKSLLTDGTYWLSVCDTTAQIMVIVEHTNFMDKKHYDNEHLVYIGNYMPTTSPLFTNTKEEVLKVYDPFLRKINPTYQKSLIGYELFKAPFAQPIIPQNYSKIIPPFTTPFRNVLLANMQQVYPWDRGTNYAVELGEKVAKLIEKSV